MKTYRLGVQNFPGLLSFYGMKTKTGVGHASVLLLDSPSRTQKTETDTAS